MQRHEWTLENETLGDLGGVPDSREHVERLRPCSAAHSSRVRRELVKGRRKRVLSGPDSFGLYEKPSQPGVGFWCDGKPVESSQVETDGKSGRQPEVMKIGGDPRCPPETARCERGQVWREASRADESGPSESACGQAALKGNGELELGLG